MFLWNKGLISKHSERIIKSCVAVNYVGINKFTNIFNKVLVINVSNQAHLALQVCRIRPNLQLSERRTSIETGEATTKSVATDICHLIPTMPTTSLSRIVSRKEREHPLTFSISFQFAATNGSESMFRKKKVVIL